MIRLIESNFQEILAFCERDSFGTRIAASITAYSTLGSFARFYVQEHDGELSAAISCIDGNITLCINFENADCAELLYYIRAFGCKTLICDAEFFKKTGTIPSHTGAVVSFTDSESFSSELINLKYSQSENYKSAYSILQICGFSDLGNYSDWLADISLRFRRGVSKIYLAEYGETACATASILFQTDKSAFMGGIGTLPDYRGRGIAGAMVSGIARDLTQKGMGVTLFCKEPLLKFYNKIGFKKTGSWAIMKEDKGNE